jgi:predicted NAD/FAD-dependent oxidoreductase
MQEPQLDQGRQLNHLDVIIVGAGMAGLTAAARLQQSGITTTVLDKGRVPGGRMATRRIGEASFDHGAQHFSARTAEFKEQTQRWIEQGLVREWFTSPSSTVEGRPIEPRHAGRGGMRRIAEHVAADLRVETSVAVEQIDMTSEGVAVVTSQGRTWRAAGAILTPPAPQTLPLLRRSAVPMAAAVEGMLAATSYDPCLAVMARLDSEADLSDGHATPDDGPIAWIADNQHKGVSEAPAVTIHSSPEFAEANLETDPEWWVPQLVEAGEPYLAGAVIETKGHRWRYAQPRRTFEIGATTAAPGLPVVVAGELFAGARVEGAFLSGRAAAELLENTL